MKILSNKSTIFGIKKDNLKRIHWFLGEHAFFVMLLLIFLNIIIGVFLFYGYIVLVETKKGEVINGTIKFEDAAYQQVLSQSQAKQQMFQNISGTASSNPFLASGNGPTPENPGK